MKEKIKPFKFLPRLVYMQEEVGVFLASSHRSIVAYGLSVIVSIIISFDHTPLWILGLWIGIQIVYMSVRLIRYKELVHALDTQKGIDRSLAQNIILLGLGGFLWGLSPWITIIFSPDMETIHYLLVITFGVGAGSIATLSAIYGGFVLFISALLFMQIASLLYLGGESSYFLAGFTLLFWVVAMTSARMMHRVIRKSLVRAKQLKVSQQKLSRLNDNLQEAVNQQVLEIKAAYYHDSLTGLENLFQCHEVLEVSENNYLIIIDLSGFGNINKCYGKEFADEVLIQFSDFLHKNLYTNMSLFKGESDRFVIYVNESEEVKLQEYAQTLVAFFDMQEIEIGNQSLFISFNIAAARVDNVSDVMVNCELALEDSKALGSKQYAFFNQHKEEERGQLQNSYMLKEMLENDSIIPYFQAIKDIKADKVTKYEVLARGEYQGKIISPFFFIETAKRLGLLPVISRMIIKKSFRFFADKESSFSINITEQDLSSDYLLPYVTGKLLKHNIKAERVTFEILENIDISSRNIKVVHSIKALRNLGCEIAIDDFGVENSSFLRLLELEFNYLKLDGVFIRGIESSEKKRDIVQGIVKLAQSMKIKTVAEFVENQEIYDVLKNIGVDYAQGYAVHKPAPTLLEDS